MSQDFKIMQKFIKENMAIVLAIALPVLLTAVFMISTMFSKVTVPDPTHDFFIASYFYNHDDVEFKFNVVNDRLVITYQPPKPQKNDDSYEPSRRSPKLWRVNVPEMSVEEIGLLAPADYSATNINISGVTDITVRNIHPSPDGYDYVDTYYRSGGNLMTELFADSSRRGSSGVAISKNGRVLEVTVPRNGEYWNNNAEFIGWIIETP
jgi:hypothetical protein